MRIAFWMDWTEWPRSKSTFAQMLIIMTFLLLSKSLSNKVLKSNVQKACTPSSSCSLLVNSLSPLWSERTFWMASSGKFPPSTPRIASRRLNLKVKYRPCFINIGLIRWSLQHQKRTMKACKRAEDPIYNKIGSRIWFSGRGIFKRQSSGRQFSCLLFNHLDVKMYFMLC